MNRKAHSVPEVAEMLGVSVDVIYDLIRANQIPHKRLGRRIIIPAPRFNEWLENVDEWQSAAAKT